MQDAEQWLEDCPKRVFENWLAYYRLEPFGNESELLGQIIGLLYYLACRQGGELKEIEKFVKAIQRCVMPGSWVDQVQSTGNERVTAEELKVRFAQAQKQAEKAFG